MTYDEICRRLAVVNDRGEAKAIARMLLEEKFNLTLADILCGGVESLSPDDTLWLEGALTRLERSEPVQYVLGEAWFCGNRFAVGSGVLIPRPETEWIVERALGAARDMGRGGLRVLDIGTGSGCIAISIKKALPEAYVEAWDISVDALAIAEGNARRLSADVVFKRRDALGLVPSPGSWDIIVSNPPYICDCERDSMESNVLDYEPSLALFVPDDDPLRFYRAIARYALTSLDGDGRLLLECNTRYAASTAEMLRCGGFRSVGVFDDCFGKPRFVEASDVN